MTTPFAVTATRQRAGKLVKRLDACVKSLNSPTVQAQVLLYASFLTDLEEGRLDAADVNNLRRQVRAPHVRAIAEQQIRTRVEQCAAAVSNALYRLQDSLDFLMNEVFAPSVPVSPLTAAIATGTIALSRGFVHVQERLRSTFEQSQREGRAKRAPIRPSDR
jgi:hypothetical protein